MKRIFLFLLLIGMYGALSCTDDDSFSTDPHNLLSFSADTLKMDTVFSTIASSTYSFWVFNNSDDGIRLQSVRLRSGNQTGFRVNVDGSYLDNSLGSVVHHLEVRRGDSLRVFVELTAPETSQPDPQVVEDWLVFSLESGVEQQVCLRAWAWDALQLRNLVVGSDTVIESEKPLIVYGGIQIDSAATLTIRNSTLYFHEGKGIDVYGRLLTDSVTLRGDRLDHMFDYLPYDRVSDQWGQTGGVVFHSSSTGNVLRNTEIHNAGQYGIRCDSAAYDSTAYRIDMERCVIHNCAGTGLASSNSNIRLNRCQITNTQGDCLNVMGGHAEINRCTLAQFYPLTAARGAALRFGNTSPLYGFFCDSSIVTGYADDEVWAVLHEDTTRLFEYRFTNSLLRTPRVESADSVRFANIIWESAKDSIQGKQHFRLIDEQNLIYDFRLDSLSTAQGLGCYE